MLGWGDSLCGVYGDLRNEKRSSPGKIIYELSQGTKDYPWQVILLLKFYTSEYIFSTQTHPIPVLFKLSRMLMDKGIR